MEGLHLTADLVGCECEPGLLTVAPVLAALCRDAVDRAALAVVGELFHTFDPGGVTGVILLAESHLAVHTWPECRGVTLDAYVCNYSGDNTAKAEALMRALVSAFEPGRQVLGRVRRGDIGREPGAGPVRTAG